MQPKHLANETLISYPVPIDRLDVYTRFLIPAGVSPRQHKTIETTDIMLQMVAGGRGVAALPRWLVEEQGSKFNVVPIKLGRRGVAKQIFVGFRESDADIAYLQGFVEMARKYRKGKSSEK